MAIIDVIDQNGNKLRELTLKDEVFNVKVHEPAIYLAIKQYMHNQRQWNRSTKTKGEISGGGKKPWKQKGTGRARAGSIRSPLWRSGGTTFGPQPGERMLKINKKIIKLAERSALSSKYKDKLLMVVDTFKVDQIKTKMVYEIFKKLAIRNALIVIDGGNKNFQLSARNMKRIKVIRNNTFNVYDIMKYNQLVLTERAAVELQEALNK
ncbi:MAG: 50S ribosomal protein L4 [Deltaproteobacteria bacterium]|nr:50S ribosomal protein L4 [Deltaproteobacteria bacterium]MCL5276888.1 50S ribosomal protein L4 [Deltaproteobacteria bacterium]